MRVAGHPLHVEGKRAGDLPGAADAPAVAPCGSCKTHRNGKVSYSHTLVTPVLVKPGSDKVIALAPEFIRPQDGHEKQDGEINASLRWLESRGSRYAALGTTVLGDDLYCHEPFCRALLAQGFEFILVSKPLSHQTWYEWVDDLERTGMVKTRGHTRWTGKRLIWTPTFLPSPHFVMYQEKDRLQPYIRIYEVQCLYP
ncbi:MAG: hypothetical protein PHD39_10995 [Methylobacter tundripaludum]|nr:hypothetical protein [Methylobacter tundripaludum]